MYRRSLTLCEVKGMVLVLLWKFYALRLGMVSTRVVEMASGLTQKLLTDWGGSQIVRDAESLLNRGLVLEAAYEPPLLKGAVLVNNQRLQTALKVLPDGTVENLCPCYANRERGLICVHVIALGLMIVKRETDPLRDVKYQEEFRRASRLASIPDTAYLKRVPPYTPGAIPASLTFILPETWLADFTRGTVDIRCEISVHNQVLPPESLPPGVLLSFSKREEALLFVLEDIAEGPLRHTLHCRDTDFLNVLRLRRGQTLECDRHTAIQVQSTPMNTVLKLDLDRETGELILIAHTELPFKNPGEFPTHLITAREGWVYGAGHCWPLAELLPGPYRSVYQEPVIIPRPGVLNFLRCELPLLQEKTPVETDVSEDWFTVDPAVPAFRLLVQGSLASLASTLFAQYANGMEIPAGKADTKGPFAIPDPQDLTRYLVRNLEAERRALQTLESFGLNALTGDSIAPRVGKRDVLNFLGGIIPALRRRGWTINLEGRASACMESADFATPIVHIESQGSGQRWFEVNFSFEDTNGSKLDPAEIHLALRKGESFIERGGRTILLDSEAVQSLHDVFSDCSTSDGSAPGSFRVDSLYGPYLKTSLDVLDGVDVEAPPSWRDQAERLAPSLNRTPAPIDAVNAARLRPYQVSGVNWLYTLSRSGFCGILADEMGLGKTIQALVWIQALLGEGGAAPVLIVCPTSLVENWQEEAARFTPGIRALALTGAERHAWWEQLDSYQMLITSYSLMRRDIEHYEQREFLAVVLDEAQHIKNRSTRNAVATKQLRARHRLVLTGTPMENSVTDLWSIMDFLMPGYLGRHDAFRQRFDLPISKGGAEAEQATAVLKRKLSPFLLRRLKSDVAKDLPPKIQRVSFCHLNPDQKVVYAAILEQSRRNIQNLVRQRGFERCRMEILATLMRLRQVCCHLDLLKMPDLKPENPSAKCDLFWELVDEAMDGGHRILVFSQFVSMLTILKRTLDDRGVSYCYLDGASRERMKSVHQFNQDRSIPIFLISLKAGGTGLNLTGADMRSHFDPWWNPAVEDQATDRAYRIGQQRTVYSIKLITRDTVEEKVLALQDRKRELIAATVESDEAVMQNLSWDDIKELLDLG